MKDVSIGLIGMFWGVQKNGGGMGFRNLKEFNLPLLAKQCWRLIHDPTLLWARILKN